MFHYTQHILKNLNYSFKGNREEKEIKCFRVGARLLAGSNLVSEKAHKRNRIRCVL